MKRFLMIGVLLASNSGLAQEYNVVLPTELPLNQIDDWVMNIAIVDQVCDPLPDFCLTSIVSSDNLISSSTPYSLSMVEGTGDLMVHKQISITGIDLLGLQSKPINKLVLKKQLTRWVVPSDQAKLAHDYLNNDL
ncbi:hypothetical protein OH460_08985 [Vibrio sp. Makdt]|uniref:hypothetical protein n=1 Tax=Vibrio sp. Makdt TaxID=2998828 RepID=UPI0022CD8277|nr:hypothetical protein [Vibrio sp. Makdt]MDA0152436.1 hypothetical protein [Vibrio sp. Makdt]